MADKMLIDATHPEETRVVVLRGNRVEEFDFESANRKQLRGNIYLAKVTRVEPSLQAAFVDYGGNRHGFLAFSEIHPDYYQIPVADRQALIAQEERDQRAADAEADNRAGRRGRHRHRSADRHRDRDFVQSELLAADEPASEAIDVSASEAGLGEPTFGELTETAASMPDPASHELSGEEQSREAAEIPAGEDVIEQPRAPEAASGTPLETTAEGEQPSAAAEGALTADAALTDSPNNGGEEHHEDETVESVGGADALEEVQERLPQIPATIQDSGSDQAPTGDAGSGRQGRTRH